MALERQKVFSVMLLEGVSSGRGGADAQLRRDVLPRLVLRRLQGEDRKNVFTNILIKNTKISV